MKKVAILIIMFISMLEIAIATDRIIFFAGREWIVHNRYGGPGPCNFSNSTNNVWIDQDNRLHLKMYKENGIWKHPHIETIEHTSYGNYRFYIIGRPDLQDKNVVFSPYVINTEAPPTYGEIDFEFARWSVDSYPYANYCLHYDDDGVPEYHHNFNTSLTGEYFTAGFNWSENNVVWKMIHGHYPEPPSSNFLVLNSYIDYITQPGYDASNVPFEDDNLTMNIIIWTCDIPSNGQALEYIIKDIDYPAVRYKDEYIYEYKKIKLRDVILENVYFDSGADVTYEIGRTITIESGEIGQGAIFEIKTTP